MLIQLVQSSYGITYMYPEQSTDPSNYTNQYICYFNNSIIAVIEENNDINLAILLR